MKVGIIGAGPAGLTAAYQLSKSLPDVCVYEAGPEVGGMSKSLRLWGEQVDLGPHRFFSSDKRVNELWLEVVGQDYLIVERLTRIFYNHHFFHYPLKAFNALSNLGLWDASYCLFSYIKERLHPTPQNGSFENWVVGRFGRRLFEVFFKTYSEKLWGISCQELDADFAAQRIKKLSLWEAIKNSLLTGQKNEHKTLVDRFAYPSEGSGMVYQRMQAGIEANDGKVLLEQPVQRVIVENGRAVGLELKNGTVEYYDYIISSMPLSLMVSRLLDAPEAVRKAATQLQFRHTILVYLHVAGTKLFPDNWLYVHSPDLRMGRITNFNNWIPKDDRTHSILTLEYWCYEEEEIWKASDEDLKALAQNEIVATKLVRAEDIKEGYVHRIPRCYPVYTRGYKELLSPIESYLKSIGNLSVIGRYGAFKYNNQDHSILMGIMAAENILNDRSHDLWDINTDYENYQEASVITETGLEFVN